MSTNIGIVAPPGGGGSGSGGSTAPEPGAEVDFRLGYFAPRYYPDDVRVSKKRNVETEDSLCEGQYAKDLGGKNRKVHATGVVLGKNLQELNDIVEEGIPFAFRSMQWSGEVLITKYKVSGPTHYDGPENSWWFTYTLDAISTGRDEAGETNNGIIS